MRRGIFVTGTDTGVGKTTLAAGLLVRYRREAPLRYWKPVQTGIEEDDDTATVRRLARCRPNEVFDGGIRLPRPVSPHLAARLAGVEIDVEDVVRMPASEADGVGWIVEGAGGVLVPVNDGATMADLMVRLGLPVVIAARSSLGTINHTLLTLAALRARQLTVVGVVMIGVPDAENRRAVEHYGRVTVLGEMPHWDRVGPEPLASWAADGLDPSGTLLRWLT